MLSAQRGNDIRNLTTAAAALGVALPPDLADQAAHLADLTVEHYTSPHPAAVAGDLAQFLGDRDAMTKARKKAATDLAAADAHTRIGGHLADHCARHLYGRIRSAREPIAAAFGKALAPHLDTLANTAPRLPSMFTAEKADQLDANTYTAWTKARDAAATIDSVRRALNFLYPSATGDFLGIDAVGALRHIAPPATFRGVEHAHTFADALAGMRLGGGDLGAIAPRPVFTPSACAAEGGSFVWAGPAEVAARIAHVAAGATPVTVDRQGRRVSLA